MSEVELRAQIASLEERNAAQVKSIELNIARVHDARQERDEVRRELKVAQLRIEELRAERENVAIAVAEFGGMIKRYQADVAQARDDLGIAARRAEELMATIARLRAEFENLKNNERAVASSPYRTADPVALATERDRLQGQLAESERSRKLGEEETARLNARWTKLETHVASMRRAVNGLAREVGVLRMKIAEDEHHHGLYLGDVDRAIAVALAAAQEGVL